MFTAVPPEERLLAELADIAGRQIMPMVYTPIGDAIDAAAARVGHPVTLHVCIDTGIGRVGVPFRQAAASPSTTPRM